MSNRPWNWPEYIPGITREAIANTGRAWCLVGIHRWRQPYRDDGWYCTRCGKYHPARRARTATTDGGGT